MTEKQKNQNQREELVRAVCAEQRKVRRGRACDNLTPGECGKASLTCENAGGGLCRERARDLCLGARADCKALKEAALALGFEDAWSDACESYAQRVARRTLRRLRELSFKGVRSVKQLLDLVAPVLARAGQWLLARLAGVATAGIGMVYDLLVFALFNPRCFLRFVKEMLCEKEVVWSGRSRVKGWGVRGTSLWWGEALKARDYTQWRYLNSLKSLVCDGLWGVLCFLKTQVLERLPGGAYVKALLDTLPFDGPLGGRCAKDESLLNRSAWQASQFDADDWSLVRSLGLSAVSLGGGTYSAASGVLALLVANPITSTAVATTVAAGVMGMWITSGVSRLVELSESDKPFGCPKSAWALLLANLAKRTGLFGAAPDVVVGYARGLEALGAARKRTLAQLAHAAVESRGAPREAAQLEFLSAPQERLRLTA